VETKVTFPPKSFLRLFCAFVPPSVLSSFLSSPLSLSPSLLSFCVSFFRSFVNPLFSSFDFLYFSFLSQFH